MAEETITITLTVEEATKLRRSIIGGGFYIDPKSPQGKLLQKMKEAGLTRPNFARCPHCWERLTSEQSLYNHLRTKERYPMEDAGTTASRRWASR